MDVYLLYISKEAGSDQIFQSLSTCQSYFLGTNDVVNAVRVCVCVPRPRLVDMSKVYRQTNVENLEQAFNVAENDLGVTRLLDPEGKAHLRLWRFLPLA